MAKDIIAADMLMLRDISMTPSRAVLQPTFAQSLSRIEILSWRCVLASEAIEKGTPPGAAPERPS